MFCVVQYSIGLVAAAFLNFKCCSRCFESHMWSFESDEPIPIHLIYGMDFPWKCAKSWEKTIVKKWSLVEWDLQAAIFQIIDMNSWWLMDIDQAPISDSHQTAKKILSHALQVAYLSHFFFWVPDSLFTKHWGTCFSAEVPAVGAVDKSSLSWRRSDCDITCPGPNRDLSSPSGPSRLPQQTLQANRFSDSIWLKLTIAQIPVMISGPPCSGSGPKTIVATPRA